MFSIENPNSVSFYFETKWLRRMKQICRRKLANKTDNNTVSYKQPTGKILTLIRLQISQSYV